MAALDPEIRKFLNAEFPDDVEVDIHDAFAAKTKLRDELISSFEVAERSGRDANDQTLEDFEAMRRQLDEIDATRVMLEEQYKARSGESRTLAAALDPLVERLHVLERAHAYLEHLLMAHTASVEAMEHLQTDLTRAVSCYAQLLTMYRKLRTSAYEELRTHVFMQVQRVFSSVTERLIAELKDTLEAMQWPTPVGKMLAKPDEYEDALGRFDLIFGLLLDVKSPYDDEDEEELDMSVPILTRVERILSLAPMKLLLEAIETRFRYHFSGRRETNRIDKPEWMFTFVLNTIKEHQPFVVEHIQPLLDKRGYDMDAVVAFAYGLIQMLNRKLEREMYRFVLSRAFLSHAIAESLNFENELRGEIGYPQELPCCVQMFVDVHERFSKWLDFETKFALQQFSEILESRTAMALKYNDVADVDTLRPTEAAADIACLLQSVTERYTALRNPQHQYAFVKDIQLRILSEFLSEVEQTVRDKYDDMSALEHQTNFMMMLNSINYLRTVVAEWSDQVFFVQMYQALKDEESGSSDDEGFAESDEDDGDEIGGVFDEMLQSYERQCEWMVTRLVAAAVESVKPLFATYRRERWLAPAASQQQRVLESVTPSLCDALLLIKDTLTNMSNNLASPLFARAWPLFANGLSQYILHDVVLMNYFNAGGIRQFALDMQTLTKLFGQYTNKPENFLKEVKEACILLQLPPAARTGLARSVSQAYMEEGDDATASAKAALENAGVFRLTAVQASQVLERYMAT